MIGETYMVKKCFSENNRPTVKEVIILRSCHK